MSDQPTKDELLERAADGNPISQSEVDKIADTERKETGGGIAKGGAAATAQSLHDKQMHFLEVASKVADKPATEVTQKDAADVQHAEARAFGTHPCKSSISSTVQSIADKNANRQAAQDKD